MKCLKTLAYFSSINPSTSLVEKEGGQQLFLNVLVIEKGIRVLGYIVFKKFTYTDRYLHKEYDHHPVQKWVVMRSLLDRTLWYVSSSFFMKHWNTSVYGLLGGREKEQHKTNQISAVANA